MTKLIILSIVTLLAIKSQADDMDIANLKIRASTLDDQLHGSTVDELFITIKLENKNCLEKALTCGRFSHKYDKDGHSFRYQVDIQRYSEKYHVDIFFLPFAGSISKWKNLSDIDVTLEGSLDDRTSFLYVSATK
ncbi:MAG: hypothetical protein V4596_13075 [Bdellovibrionota bacterium]